MINSPTAFDDNYYDYYYDYYYYYYYYYVIRAANDTTHLLWMATSLSRGARECDIRGGGPLSIR